MTTILYLSTDPDAPQLSTASGSLTAIFDACLVNGYGAKPAAGWTKEFFQSNLRSGYKQGLGSNGHYLYLDDGAGTTVRARGFVTMDSIGNGAQPFPTDAQMPGGVYVHKHDGLAGNRGWLMVANEKAVWFVTQMSSSINWTEASLFFFGAIKSNRQADKFSTMIMGAYQAQHAGNATSPTPATNFGTSATLICPTTNVLPAHFMASAWHGLGGSVNVGKHCDISRAHDQDFLSYCNARYAKMGLYAPNTSLFANPVDGSIHLMPTYVHETGGAIRGVMPGMFAHPYNCNAVLPVTGNIIEGTGDFAGRSFMVVWCWYGSVLLEISDTW